MSGILSSSLNLGLVAEAQFPLNRCSGGRTVVFPEPSEACYGTLELLRASSPVSGASSLARSNACDTPHLWRLTLIRTSGGKGDKPEDRQWGGFLHSRG